VAENGIVQGHAYSILRVVSTTDAEEKEIRMLQIRNPWANGGALLLTMLALPLARRAVHTEA